MISVRKEMDQNQGLGTLKFVPSIDLVTVEVEEKSRCAGVNAQK